MGDDTVAGGNLTLGDLREVVTTAVQIATINTTLSQHDRRIDNLEKTFSRLQWWLVGFLGSSTTAAIFSVLNYMEHLGK